MKRLPLCITLAFSILIGAYAGLAVAEAETSPKWVAHKHPSGNFPYIFTWDGCSVGVRQEGAGITINAQDPNWRGKHITQTIVIEKDPGGAFYKFSYTRETDVTNAGYVLSLDTEDYDVFETKCAEAAKSLPIGIRRAFHGFYGIGGK